MSKKGERRIPKQLYRYTKKSVQNDEYECNICKSPGCIKNKHNEDHFEMPALAPSCRARTASLRLFLLFCSLVSGRCLRLGNALLSTFSSCGQISSDVAPFRVTSCVVFEGCEA